jgi:hypothetical protein
MARIPYCPPDLQYQAEHCGMQMKMLVCVDMVEHQSGLRKRIELRANLAG